MRIRHALATTLVLGTLLAPALSYAQPVAGDFFIVIDDDIYNFGPGGAISTPWGENLPTASQLEDICVGPGGDLFVSEFDGPVWRVVTGGDLSGLTPHATGIGAGAKLICTPTEVLTLDAAAGAIYEVSVAGDYSVAIPWASGIPGIIPLGAETSAGARWALNIFGGLYDITGGGDFSGATAFGTDSTSGLWLGFGVGPADELLGARGNQILDLSSGGDLNAAPVFATLPNGARDIEYVEGWGLFAVDRNVGVGVEVFDITAGGVLVEGAGFAQLPAGGDLRGIAYYHGCGDEVVWSTGGEECDDGAANSDTEPDACRTDCVTASCGDGVEDTGEACDDGADNSDIEPDACRTDCVVASCGDGAEDTGEECDDGAGNSDAEPDACRTDCVMAGCGDGLVDTGETCDDGAANSDTTPGACRTDCAGTVSSPSCGDGALDPGEECDDGNTASGDGCSDTCTEEPLDADDSGCGCAVGGSRRSELPLALGLLVAFALIRRRRQSVHSGVKENPGT